MAETTTNFEHVTTDPLYIKMGLKRITLDESLKLIDFTRYQHAAHCLLYFKKIDADDEGYFGLGQVRFDGYLGFPGGVVGEEEPLATLDDLLNGLRRELLEEINYISPDGNSGFQHVSSCVNHSVNLTPSKHPTCNVFHFFKKEITESEFIQCELNHTKSIHFPLESMGIFRIPLIDPSSIGQKSIYRFYTDKGTFLINFFAHNFAGNAKSQLYDSLVTLNCMSPEYMSKLEKLINE